MTLDVINEWAVRASAIKPFCERDTQSLAVYKLFDLKLVCFCGQNFPVIVKSWIVLSMQTLYCSLKRCINKTIQYLLPLKFEPCLSQPAL